MLNSKELDQIERQMREEHARDLEALQRLRRYLPGASGASAVVAPSSGTNGTVPPAQGHRPGLQDILLRIIDLQPEKRWTRPELDERLSAEGFSINAKDRAAALNQALRTLVGNERIRLLVQGTGSSLSEYSSVHREIPR